MKKQILRLTGSVWFFGGIIFYFYFFAFIFQVDILQHFYYFNVAKKLQKFVLYKWMRERERKERFDLANNCTQIDD